MENPKKLYRSRRNRMLGGVCGGIAEYFNIDPTLVRLIWVLSTIGLGFGIWGYLLAWLIIPNSPE
jgi:phage shock protein C